MSPRRACILAWAMALACLVGLCLTSCHPECARQEHDACWYGETLTDETRAEIARVLPLLPADPWPCVATVEVGCACPGTHGCYYPDTGRIVSTQAALPHEIAHAAAECAGDYDPEHRAAFWREVDR